MGVLRTGKGDASFRRVVASALLAAALFAAAGALPSFGTAGRILVLMSKSGAPYDEALAGFQGYLQRQGMGGDVRVHPLEGGAGARAAQDARKDGSEIVVAFGGAAASLAQKEASSVPLVAGMVLRTESLVKGGATAVSLEFPVETQMIWLRRFLPDCRTVAFLHNPKEHHGKVEVVEAAARKAGMKVLPLEVRSTEELPETLRSLPGKADAIWGLPDEVVFSQAAAKHLIPFSLKNRLPVVGISPAWVKAGAVYSLECDYKDLGVQCAEMAMKVLKGAKPSAIPPGAPRTVLYSLNMNSAREMKLEIPDALLRSARQVY